MKRWSYLAGALGLAVLVFLPVAIRVLTWEGMNVPEADRIDVADGAMLFSHEWQANDPLCNGGDGLGPVFNAKSCTACHNQGGTGGGGGLEHNVTSFVVASQIDPEQIRNDGFSFNKRREGVLHANAVSDHFRETLDLVDPSFQRFSELSLKQVLGADKQALLKNPNCGTRLSISLAQRNTPALFGAGLIDAIPDRVILLNLRQSRMKNGLALGKSDGVAVGRVARLKDGRIGRFGWKAQSANLSDFVQAACANELGLSNPAHDQPTPLGVPDYKAVSLDLTQKQCDQMTSFIASLPRPAAIEPEEANAQAKAHKGRELFGKVGCAACHTPSLGSVSGIYSDLLLHHMGQDLESETSSYGGARPTVPSSENDVSPDEWRTPPLWGVADSAPYMHDGRAPTLEKAIELHGGQGKHAAFRFAALAPSSKDQLLSFLKTLRAPRAETLAKK